MPLIRCLIRTFLLLLVTALGSAAAFAAQDARWFTEKGFYIGLSFPGSGAVAAATDGDIWLETGTLTVSDNHDTDRYSNIGGSIGLKGGRLDTVGFSYEKKDRQGETRTTLDAAGTLDVTIHDADRDGVRDTGADRAAADQLIASLNKDAATWQQITRDDDTRLSGELNVSDLAAFSENARAIADYMRAVNAPVPGAVAAQGPENVDYYRRLLASGLTPGQASEALGSAEVQSLVSTQRNWNNAVDFYGGPARVPAEIRAAIANGIVFDFSQGKPLVERSGCETFGMGCLFEYRTDTAEGFAKAQIAVAEARATLEQLVPELDALIARALAGDTSVTTLELGILKARIEKAAFTYELCQDTVGVEKLASLLRQVSSGLGNQNGATQGDTTFAVLQGYLAGVRTDTARAVFKADHPGRIETADDEFALLAGGAQIAGKFIVVNGVKVYRTVAGTLIGNKTIDYLTAKGMAFVDDAGNLFVRKAPNRTLTAVEQQKVHHIFGQDKHKMDPLVQKFCSQENAYFELNVAAQSAYQNGQLNISANSVNTETRILVGGVEVDLVGGRVVNGNFILVSASRRDIQ